jgi:hypothetical protein
MNKLILSLLMLSLAMLIGCSGTELERDKPERLASEGERQLRIQDVLTRDVSTASIKVNRYIWQASLEVLDFMPIEKIDPFSGVIVMGYGVPPGGKTKYEATVLVTEPALDARTLRVSLRTPSGPADPETMRALEDAILSRARQLREADAQL